MIVVCLGIPRSGSTWTFNVVRDLVEAAIGSTAAFEAASLDGIELALAGKPYGRGGKPRAIVIRCHTLSESMLRFLLVAGARFILTTRDPRDAVASLCLQLGGHASGWSMDVGRSIAAVATVQREGKGQVFAYEEGFIDNPDTLSALADYLGLSLSKEVMGRIASTWEKEKVMARVKGLAAEVPTIYGFRSDETTGLHESHIGDGRIGKWRDAIPAWQSRLIDQAFGGCASPQLGPCPGDVIRFCEPLFGLAAQPVGIERFTDASTSLGVRLMALCFLGTGHWRITLQGELPPWPYPSWLRVVVGGRLLFETLVTEKDAGDGSGGTMIAAEVDFEHVCHDHQMEILIENPYCTLPDPFRARALELQASRM